MKWWDRLPWSYSFECWVLKHLFHSPFPFIKKLFCFSLLSAIRVVSSAYLRFFYFSWKSWFQLMIHLTQHFSWCTLHRIQISRVTIHCLTYSFPNFETILCCIAQRTLFNIIQKSKWKNNLKNRNICITESLCCTPETNTTVLSPILQYKIES